MGWDYTHATHYTRTGAIDKKAEIDELYTWQNDTKKYEVVRSCMVGATYYAAAYQFKRPFWFCQSSGRYMPATRIPANYEVVTA